MKGVGETTVLCEVMGDLREGMPTALREWQARTLNQADLWPAPWGLRGWPCVDTTRLADAPGSKNQGRPCCYAIVYGCGGNYRSAGTRMHLHRCTGTKLYTPRLSLPSAHAKLHPSDSLQLHANTACCCSVETPHPTYNRASMPTKVTRSTVALRPIHALVQPQQLETPAQLMAPREWAILWA